MTFPLCGVCQWLSSGPLPSQHCSPLLCFQRTRDTQNLYCMDGHLLKLKCKYSNILRCWFLTFISCKQKKKCLKCFTLHVMNLKYMKVSLWNELFDHILIFWVAPVYIYIYIYIYIDCIYIYIYIYILYIYIYIYIYCQIKLILKGLNKTYFYFYTTLSCRYPWTASLSGPDIKTGFRRVSATSG